MSTLFDDAPQSEGVPCVHGHADYRLCSRCQEFLTRRARETRRRHHPPTTAKSKDEVSGRPARPRLSPVPAASDPPDGCDSWREAARQTAEQAADRAAEAERRRRLDRPAALEDAEVLRAVFKHLKNGKGLP